MGKAIIKFSRKGGFTSPVEFINVSTSKRIIVEIYWPVNGFERVEAPVEVLTVMVLS